MSIAVDQYMHDYLFVSPALITVSSVYGLMEISLIATRNSSTEEILSHVTVNFILSNKYVILHLQYFVGAFVSEISTYYDQYQSSKTVRKACDSYSDILERREEAYCSLIAGGQKSTSLVDTVQGTY